MELAPQLLPLQPVPHPSGGEFIGSGSAVSATWPPNQRPTTVFVAEVVKVTSMLTALLPQFLKQSGSLSGTWASPGSPPPSRLGNETVTAPEQAGEQAKLKFRTAGFSLTLTASKGSDGTLARVAPEKMAAHVGPLMKGGKFAHWLRPEGPAGMVSSTLARKS